ncbi:MAG TPA: energy transducer TonB [Gammaproteobacteria bacterium]|nr:energy transducer TonB [Gammaproteobacteria bacterium]
MNSPSPALESREITSRDRLVTTLFFAALVHGIIILGIGFSSKAFDSPLQSRLEVTLVTGRQTARPDSPDYLAQINQRGNGNTRRHVRPRSAMATPAAMDHAGLPDAADLAFASPSDIPQLDPDATRASATRVAQQLVTALESPRQAPSAARAVNTESRHVLRLSRLVERSRPDRRGTDDRTRTARASSRDPRDKFISVNTRSSVYAPYLTDWRRKVEQVGNLHFPDQAARAGLSGTVTVEVAVNADGSLRNVRIVKPSHHKVLDRAVLRILRLAAPFAPFSRAMRKDARTIHFAYEWRFLAGDGQATAKSAVYASPGQGS